MKNAHIALALLAAVLGGCASTPRDLSAFSGEIRYAPTDAVAIHVDDAIVHRAEGINKSKNAHFITGTIWSKVFVGSSETKDTFTITESHLLQGGTPFVVRFEYTAKGVLRHDGRDYTIECHGARSSGMMLLSAMRQAVELAVVDAARQAKSIITANASKT